MGQTQNSSRPFSRKPRSCAQPKHREPRHYRSLRAIAVSALISLTASQVDSSEPNATAQLATLLSPQLPPAQIIWAQAPTVLQQGTQVVLNGRTLTGAWSQWQQGNETRFWMSDAGLMQILGVELLSSNDLARQPIQWFSPSPAPTLSLPTRLSNQYRYLDLSELASRNGWRIQAQGNTLNITSTPATFVGIRQGKQAWGDRIVIDLDRATPWQVVQQGQSLTLTLDAQVSPALVKAFKPLPGNRLTSLKLSNNGNVVTLQVGLPAVSDRPRVWTLSNPNRLIIDVRAVALEEKNILWAPGVRWRQQQVALGSSAFPVIWLEVDPRQAEIALKPIWSNPQTQVGTAPLVDTARIWQTAAAINAGFFNRNNQLPLGAIRRDNRWLSGPILNRGAMAWSDRGEFKMARLSLQETLVTTAGSRLPILYLNSGYVQSGISRYTPEWGPNYTPLTNNELISIVRGNTIVAQQQLGVAGTAPVAIPSDGYLLAVRGSQAAAQGLGVGTRLQIESRLTPAEFEQYPQILGAGPLLVQNRQVVLDAKGEQFSEAFIQQRAPRSAIATTDRGTLILAAIHHRADGLGPTLAETAQLMQRMGAIEALNLDGGSSTSLYLGGQLVDRPPRNVARVHNGLGIFVTPR
ncbi:phosphodiester glycosidase family protein [Desertifilum sp. FACHB-1129]|uniref:Phosphodiester glycosidase domain-containing protein n=2 Tax=Desertifilum tharense IPPAS B-1220 TaxID=1781255 RepID=A0A1E5QCJ5_9CYAN|nr:MULTISPECIES: phosphodiester glycosidase family protein [Desertifilum]MDA0210870.1 phosphodiester glycosidase family protein [Cyanobacteria bacterium FC1]MBD2312103.1 phosphodiester glycosidase family protein [Desertifilum sp. FACHB-1129]MBD2322236.1 phosphodiester glycosidase family protein [Desertifilum sp. FACHB-866]MBD2332273.1 phosphodiester glycosidase family protein [Desertifilum sp. FACHB-868]OEJ72369.1 hypothetical protein BH720_25150 [Desertifilum tharense IPPAS B-1220]